MRLGEPINHLPRESWSFCYRGRLSFCASPSLSFSSRHHCTRRTIYSISSFPAGSAGGWTLSARQKAGVSNQASSIESHTVYLLTIISQSRMRWSSIACLLNRVSRVPLLLRIFCRLLISIIQLSATFNNLKLDWFVLAPSLPFSTEVPKTSRKKLPQFQPID